MENAEIKVENNQTVIYLKGRVDTVSAPKVEEYINSQEITGDLTLDCENLVYISSSGLRVVLKLARKYPEMKLVKVSEEVYEIFDVTGFTDILNIVK